MKILRLFLLKFFLGEIAIDLYVVEIIRLEERVDEWVNKESFDDFVRTVVTHYVGKKEYMQTVEEVSGVKHKLEEDYVDRTYLEKFREEIEGILIFQNPTLTFRAN